MHMLNRSPSGIANWELESIILQRTFHCLNQASSTLKVKLPNRNQHQINITKSIRDSYGPYNLLFFLLQSLYQLLSQIENIVVSEAVRDEIVTSLEMNLRSKDALFKGNVQEAYQSAQISLDCAEKAFFDPSLLALLYFPDDQKYLPIK